MPSLLRSGSDFYRGRNRERLVFVGEVIAAVAGACLRVQETMIEEQQALLADLQETKGRARDLLLLRYAHDLKPRQSIF
jgi:RNA polymerase sigma-70 factor (ECF subfamily)